MGHKIKKEHILEKGKEKKEKYRWKEERKEIEE
jgi:hypothetical protein